MRPERDGRVGRHFRVSEFRSHDGAPLPARQLHWIRRLALDWLEPLRSEFGPVTIVSGHRSVTHNQSVGGAPSSFHLSIRGRPGAAADVRCARGTPREWFDFLDARGAHGLGLYETWVHVDNRRGTARW